MPAPVFYSVCPYGTTSIETGAGNISIASGVATLTEAQTGNIGAGVCIEYNSLGCWIAPNRIAFTSGGTAELKLDTKITGGTSGATGIIRFIEVTSGTWAGGDAAGWIYFESTTGTWNSSEQINRTKPTASTNIATTNGSLEGNISNGNTQFVVKTATGGTPANQSAIAVDSVHHEYASLSTFEGGFTDANHINNTSLVAADVVAHACCYYDHVDYTADTGVTIDFGTTDSTRYLICYAPVGDAEGINQQNSPDGVWNPNKYKLVRIDNHVCQITQTHTKIIGLQTDNPGTSSNTILNWDSEYITVKNCIVKGRGVQSYGFNISGEVSYIINCLIYDSTTEGANSRFHENGYWYHCTVQNSTNNNYNIQSATTRAINCISQDAGGVCFDSGFTNSSHNLSQDATAPGTNAQLSKTLTFKNKSGDDFNLVAGDTDAIGKGTDLSSEGIWRDIAGNERGSTPCIGAFEYVVVGDGLPIPVAMSNYLRQMGA